jgi:hypothetical protein
VSVESDLALDIRQALQAVSQVGQAIDQVTRARLVIDTSGVAPAITGAVDAADTTVTVTGDATELTGDVTAAVDAGDSAVTVTGDAAEVTGSVTAAVDAADSHVEVTADAPDVTGSINAAVAAADTHVTIDADDGGSLGALAGSLDDVNLGLVAASGSGLKLRAVIQAISAAGLGVGLFQAAQSASDLAESTSKATVVFGQAVDEVLEFGETSASSIGLSEQAALEATGTFGNLFVALGTTKDQAADLAPEVVTLAGDLASFNNLGVDETLEKLRSGLVGEIEPLRSLGISFDAAAVEAKAMELGLVGANGAISEGAKLQARWALILEQSGTAQGDFARTSEGLANQQRILTAEFQNGVATLGQALLPALLDGVGVARDELIPAFVEIGQEVLPALADSFVALLPLAGSFASLFVALAPVLTAVAGAIAAVPPELITLLGLLAAFRRVGGSDLFTGLRNGFRDLADPNKGPGGFGRSLRASVGNMIAANAASIGLSLGLAAIGLAFEEEAKKAAEFDRAVRTIQTTLDTATSAGADSADAFGQVFETLIEQGGSFASVLASVGVDADEFGRLVAKGGDLSEVFARQLGVSVEELGLLGNGLEDFEKQIQAASEAQVEMIKAQGELSEGTIKAAEARNTETTEFAGQTIAVVDYVAVLGELTAEQQRLAEQIGVTVDETGQLTTATGPAATEADRLALSLAAVRQEGGNTGLELAGLAQAADGARVAEEDLQNVADTLGVSLADLQTFVSSVNDAINTFADQTLSTLPTVGDIIGDLGDDFSPQALLDKLTEATESIADFQTNIESLAAFPRVQQIAAENGPLIAAALAQPVKDGNTQVLADLEAQAGAFGLHYAGLDASLRNELGPQIAEATGLTGTLATEAFGENFNPEVVAINSAGQTIASIEQESGTIEEAGRGFGQSGTDGFKTGVSGMSTEGAGEADRSVAEISARQVAAAIAGGFVGGRASSGLKTGAAGMSTAAGGATDNAIGAVSSRSGAASSAGREVGAAIGQGMQSGINSVAASVANAAAALVEGAIASAKAEAKVGSPSRLFAELGRDMADGVMVGLEEGQAGVADAAAALVGVGAAATADRLAVDVRRFGDGGGAVGSPVVVQGVAGMFQVILPPGFDPSQAVATGADIGRGFLSFVQQQQVRTIARSQV